MPNCTIALLCRLGNRSLEEKFQIAPGGRFDAPIRRRDELRRPEGEYLDAFRSDGPKMSLAEPTLTVDYIIDSMMSCREGSSNGAC